MNNDNQLTRDEFLDKAGRAILRAAAASEAEIEQTLASPFLYAKIRRRMQNQKPATLFHPSLMLFSIMRQAIPILALIAIVAVCSYNFSGQKSAAQKPPAPIPFEEQQAYLHINNTKTPVTACSIASRTECVVSTDEVVALLVNSNERQNKNEFSK